MTTTAPSLTVIVLTRNEARHLAACLRTLAFAERRIVLDCGSTDGTQEIAKANGAELFHRDFDDFSSQRNHALTLTNSEWVLMIDADERVPSGLAEEICAVVNANPPRPENAFRLPRRNYYLGKPLRIAGAGRDSVVRLFRKGKIRWENLVHESVKVEGATGELLTPLEHHTVTELADSLRKMTQYSLLSGQELHRRGRRTNPLAILTHTAARFLKVYIFHLGVLEGGRGLLIAGCESAGVFFKYSRLWELQRTAAPETAKIIG